MGLGYGAWRWGLDMGVGQGRVSGYGGRGKTHLKVRKEAGGGQILKRLLQLPLALARHGASADGLHVLWVDGHRHPTVLLRTHMIIQHRKALRAVAVEDRNLLMLWIGCELDGLGVLLDGLLV